MFLKYLVLVILVLDFFRSESAANSCNLSILPPDPDSGCCGIDASGGKNLPIKQFPWLALIEYWDEYENSYDDVCNGALISGLFVLTAAQCVELDGSNPASVRLGEFDKSNELGSKDCINQGLEEECTSGAFRIPVDSSTPHPLFQGGNMESDIALIKLAKMVSYTSYVRPLCLPSSDITLNPPADFNLVVAGWGMIQRNNDSKHADFNMKRHINLPFWTSERCKVRWSSINGANQLCAGGDGISGCCLGDSGSPVMYDNAGVYQAVGVVSFGGMICAMKNTPDVSTKVFTYRDWINEVMEENKGQQVIEVKAKSDKEEPLP